MPNDWRKDTVRIDITELDNTHKQGRKGTMGVDDIQRIYDKLDVLSGQLSGLLSRDSDYHKAIHGNGLPGLLSRTTILEQAVISLSRAHDDCPAREAMSGNARRQVTSNILALASVAIALLAVLVAMK
jgi:hypothetical protein